MKEPALDQIRSVLFGVAVGDALGVPVEFCSRHELALEPVTTMRSGGLHGMPAGTWSDDSSLTFCLADALCQPFSIETIAQHLLSWYNDNRWTAQGYIFDIGIATRRALHNIHLGIPAECCGGENEWDNGNGSLMRILPLVFYLQHKNIDERFNLARKVSAITHQHIRSIIACFYYLEFARYLLQGKNKHEIYFKLQTEILEYLLGLEIDEDEIAHFDRLLKQDISEFSQDNIRSSGYVVHTLEASIWCLLKSENYAETVLRAVNLGEDTDTTAAVVGGLAGLLYGIDNIPVQWLHKIARQQEIEQLAQQLAQALESPPFNP